MNVKHAFFGIAAACVGFGALAGGNASAQGPVDAPAAHAQAAPQSVVGTFTLRNINTGRCIDDSAQYGLRSFGCNGSNYQRWTVNYSSYEQSYRNVATGRCLDDSAAGLRSFSCNGLSYQLFTSGVFNSVSAVRNTNTGRCIDDSAQYGLRSFGCNGSNYQLWEQSD